LSQISLSLVWDGGGPTDELKQLNQHLGQVTKLRQQESPARRVKSRSAVVLTQVVVGAGGFSSLDLSEVCSHYGVICLHYSDNNLTQL
jgi:hypothetical protein